MADSYKDMIAKVKEEVERAGGTVADEEKLTRFIDEVSRACAVKLCQNLTDMINELNNSPAYSAVLGKACDSSNFALSVAVLSACLGLFLAPFTSGPEPMSLDDLHEMIKGPIAELIVENREIFGRQVDAFMAQEAAKTRGPLH